MLLQFHVVGGRFGKTHYPAYDVKATYRHNPDGIRLIFSALVVISRESDSSKLHGLSEMTEEAVVHKLLSIERDTDAVAECD